MFLKIMHEKTHLQQRWLKSRKTRASFKKKNLQLLSNNQAKNFCTSIYLVLSNAIEKNNKKKGDFLKINRRSTKERVNKHKK